MDDESRQEYLTYEEAGFKSQAQQDFWYKSVPVLIIGFIIWGVTSFVFSEVGIIMDIGIFILFMVLDIATWIIIYVRAGFMFTWKKLQKSSACFMYMVHTFSQLIPPIRI